MFNHVMLDIETLGQGPNAQITSIAAVEFDIETGATQRTFHEHINIAKCKYGFDLEPDTILWWFKQSKAAQEAFLLGQKNSKPFSQVLTEFESWFRNLCYDDSLSNKLCAQRKIQAVSDICIWGRGPRFDMGILTNAYNKLGRPIPWDFRNERCVRTIEWFAPRIKQNTTKVDITGHGADGGGLHDGLLDALYQIKYVSETIKRTVIIPDNVIS